MTEQQIHFTARPASQIRVCGFAQATTDSNARTRADQSSDSASESVKWSVAATVSAGHAAVTPEVGR